MYVQFRVPQFLTSRRSARASVMVVVIAAAIGWSLAGPARGHAADLDVCYRNSDGVLRVAGVGGPSACTAAETRTSLEARSPDEARPNDQSGAVYVTRLGYGDSIEFSPYVNSGRSEALPISLRGLDEGEYLLTLTWTSALYSLGGLFNFGPDSPEVVSCIIYEGERVLAISSVNVAGEEKPVAGTAIGYHHVAGPRERLEVQCYTGPTSGREGSNGGVYTRITDFKLSALRLNAAYAGVGNFDVGTTRPALPFIGSSILPTSNLRPSKAAQTRIIRQLPPAIRSKATADRLKGIVERQG